jgi:hypothetical protein
VRRPDKTFRRRLAADGLERPDGGVDAAGHVFLSFGEEV